MNLDGWEYDELGKEMRDATMGTLLEMYKREEKKYVDKCFEYVKFMSKVSEEDRLKLEQECEFLQGAKMKLALEIADTLTK